MGVLFRKDMEKRCAYCTFGTAISDREVACTHRGVVDSGGHCRRFSYDPLKRVPPRPASLGNQKHSAEEFTL